MRRFHLIAASILLSTTLALAQPPSGRGNNSSRNQLQPPQQNQQGRAGNSLPDLDPIGRGQEQGRQQGRPDELMEDGRPPMGERPMDPFGQAHEALKDLQRDLEAKGLDEEANRLAAIIDSMPPMNNPNDGIRPEPYNDQNRRGDRGENRPQGDAPPEDRQLSGRDIIVQRMMLGENIERYSTKVMELEELKAQTTDPEQLKKIDKAIELQINKRGEFLDDFRKNAPDALERITKMEERIQSSPRFQQVPPEMQDHLKRTRELLMAPSTDDQALFNQLKDYVQETPLSNDDVMQRDNRRDSDQHLRRIEREIQALKDRLETLEEERGILGQSTNPALN